jgi:hypothetical protein
MLLPLLLERKKFVEAFVSLERERIDWQLLLVVVMFEAFGW